MLLSIASILTALQAGQSIDEAFTTIPNPSTIDYTAFQQAGMYDVYGMFPIGNNDTCSNSSNANTGWTTVEAYAKTRSPPQCCYQFPKQASNCKPGEFDCAVGYNARRCNVMLSSQGYVVCCKQQHPCPFLSSLYRFQVKLISIVNTTRPDVSTKQACLMVELLA